MKLRKTEFEDRLLPGIAVAASAVIATFNTVMHENDSNYLDQLSRDIDEGRKTLRAQIDICVGGMVHVKFFALDDADPGVKNLIIELYGKSNLNNS